MNQAPRSWLDVVNCSCHSCHALAAIFRRCAAAREPLFVIDCRMYGRGFKAGSVLKLFVEPAHEGPDFPDLESAAAYVLARQKHCDAFVSSFPLKLPGERDYRWSAENFDPVEAST